MLKLEWLNKAQLLNLISLNKFNQESVDLGFFKYFNENNITGEMLVAHENNIIKGLVEIEQEKDSQGYYLHFVSVHPEFRRQGISSLMLEEVIVFLMKKSAPFLKLAYAHEGYYFIMPKIIYLAKKYPNFTIFHRLYNSQKHYQNAFEDFLEEGHEIELLKTKIKGEILSLSEFPLVEVLYPTNDGKKCLKIDFKEIKKL